MSTANTSLTVRVHVIEVRNVVGRDESGMSDPLVVVRLRDEEQATRPLHQTTGGAIDHLMEFEVVCPLARRAVAGLR